MRKKVTSNQKVLSKTILFWWPGSQLPILGKAQVVMFKNRRILALRVILLSIVYAKRLKQHVFVKNYALKWYDLVFKSHQP